MIDKQLVTTLFNYLKANPEMTESAIISFTADNSDHTVETATQWFNAFYIGLSEALILDEATFEKMKNKIIILNELSVDQIIEVMEKYLIENPLQYQKDIEIATLEEELILVEDEPNTIEMPNDEKMMKIDEINNRLDFLKQ